MAKFLRKGQKNTTDTSQGDIQIVNKPAKRCSSVTAH